MSAGIEMTFLSVPKPPDPLEDPFILGLRIAAVTYLRRHPECFHDKWWKLRRAAVAYRQQHPDCEPTAASLTDAQITNLIANYKRTL